MGLRGIVPASYPSEGNRWFGPSKEKWNIRVGSVDNISLEKKRFLL